MFTFLAVIQTHFSFNRKLHVAFINFEKAFDSLSRKPLWPFLAKIGVTGKLYRGIRSMYKIVKARVRCGAHFTDYVS